MKTTSLGSVFIIQEPDEDCHIVFQGTMPEMKKYLVWYARANQCAKPEVISDSAILVTPELGEDD